VCLGFEKERKKENPNKPKKKNDIDTEIKKEEDRPDVK